MASIWKMAGSGAQGAGVGSMIGGPIGAGIGGAIGLASGFFGSNEEEERAKQAALARATATRYSPWLNNQATALTATSSPVDSGASSLLDYLSYGYGQYKQGEQDQKLSEVLDLAKKKYETTGTGSDLLGSFASSRPSTPSWVDINQMKPKSIDEMTFMPTQSTSYQVNPWVDFRSAY